MQIGRDDDPLRQVFLLFQVIGHDRVDILADRGAKLDRGVRIARRERFLLRRNVVDRDHQEVLARLQPGFLHRLDRAELHVVVMGEHAADALQVVGRLDEGLHHLLAAVGGEIAALRLDDLHVREEGDDRLEPFLALYRRRGADGALQLDDVAVALARLGEPRASEPALEIEVGRNAGDEEGFICCVDVAVGQEDRNAGFFASAST